MLNRRHHIHVVCVAHDQPKILDSLAVFFQAQAFLTYDVSTRLPQSALYGRQCIDACSYIIVVIGDSYGAAQNIGASQMHLSYLSAKAKLKPMLVLIKTHCAEERISRQLQDFTRLVEQQSNHIYYYNDNTNIKQLLTYAYNQMTANYKLKATWLQEDNVINNAVRQSIASQSSLIQKKLAATGSYRPKPEAMTSAITANNTNNTNNDYSYSNTQSKTKAYQADITASNSVNSNSINAIAIADNLTTVISLDETFDIQYSAQAYEGGNLTDIVMSMTLTWQEVLQALAQISASFSSYGLKSCLNRLIASKAEPEIKQLMPNVHAVSRHQISKKDVAKLHQLLVAANWIQMTSSGTHTMQELWKLTFYARRLFEESIFKERFKM